MTEAFLTSVFFLCSCSFISCSFECNPNVGDSITSICDSVLGTDTGGLLYRENAYQFVYPDKYTKIATE